MGRMGGLNGARGIKRVIGLVIAFATLVPDAIAVGEFDSSSDGGDVASAVVGPRSEPPVAGEPLPPAESTPAVLEGSVVDAPVFAPEPTPTSEFVEPVAPVLSSFDPTASPVVEGSVEMSTGFDPVTSVELVSKREEFSTTYRNADGTESVEMSSMPVHFRDEAGSWQRVDNRVVVDERGVLVSAANAWQVSFEPMTASGGVTIDTSDGVVRFVAEGAAPDVVPVREPDGVSVRYRDVFPDTDLVYVVTGVGVEELLILKSEDATANVSFVFDGAQFDEKPGLMDARGGGIGERLRLSAPETFDADGRPVDVSDQVFETTDLPAGDSRVEVGVTDEFVASLDADQFPVTVDPSVAVGFGASWVHSYARYGGTANYYASYNDGWARVGNPYLSSTSAVRWRSTAFFDYSGYYGANVVDAFVTTNVVDGTTNGVRGLNVWWASQDEWHFAGGGVAPLRYPTVEPNSSAAVSDWNQTLVSSSISSGAANHWGSALRDTYNRWLRQGTYGGVLFLTGDESATYTMKKFSISLTLTINRWPSAPTGSAGPRSGSWVPFPGASASDPDGDTVYFVHRLYNTATAEYVDFGSNWTTQNWAWVQAPSNWTGQLIQMQEYTWDGFCMATYSECHVSGPTQLGSFTNTPPNAPTLAVPAPGVQTHNFTQTLYAYTTTDPQSDPITYQFFQCTDSNCTTRQMLAGTPTVSGGTVSQTVTFNSAFYGQQLWWGVMAQDNWPTQTFSVARPITFVNAAPTATLVSPINTALLTNQMPLLTAQVADTDDLAVNYRFEATPTNGTGILAASPWASVSQAALGSPATVSFQMPSWLSSKTGYIWKVLVKDANGASGTSASWTLSAQSRLGADVASPMQQVGPLQVNLATGNLFLAVGAGRSVETVGGPMSVSMSYNSQDLSALGLRGTYYVDANSNGAPDAGEVKMVRTDSMPNFNWGAASPAESVDADFKVRWEGTLRIPAGQGGDWLFAGGHDDNLKITVTKNGGAPSVVYNSGCPGPCIPLGDLGVFGAATAITLAPTDTIKIQIDYSDTGGGAFTEFRAQRMGANESLVSADWFSVSNEQVLPTGWTLSVDTGLAPMWTKVEIGENELTATAADGSQTVWSETVLTVPGATAPVTSWVPTNEVDDIAAVNADGTATITAGDGLLYRFGVDGNLVDVTAAADTLKPAGARRIYDPGTNAAAVPRLTRLEDRVAPTRSITLRYNQAGIGQGLCPDSSPPPGMLCEIIYPDNTSTKLYYSNGLLARISDPGDESTLVMSAAPEGRSVTDLVWTNGKLQYVYTPSNTDRITAQDAPGSTIPVGERIPSGQLRTEITWSGTKPTAIALPTPIVGQPRPGQTIVYATASTTTVQVAGLAGNARSVTFDAAGRVTQDQDAALRTTYTTWANGTDAVLRTTANCGAGASPTACGRSTVNVYDPEWHLVDRYGPALWSCFTQTAPPVASQWQSYPPTGCTNAVPRTHTDYDHNFNGLQGTHWSTSTFTQAPVGNGMGPNANGHVDYTWPDPTAPTGITNQDNWTVRYTGLFYPPATGNYIFRITSGATDSATLYINDVAQLRTSPSNTDLPTGTIVLNSTAPMRVRIDFKAGTGTSSLRFGYGYNGAATSFAIGNTLKPGFWYATRTTATDTSGSAQVPPQVVTETRFNEGIDPVYGILTSTILDPSGLALKTLEGFESPGTGSLLRRTRHTLPAFAASPTSANSTSYAYYPLSPAPGSSVANPCVASSPAVDQGGRLQFETSPTPAGGSAVATETVYDIIGRPVATRYVGESSWTCTSYDARGRTTQVSIPAYGTQPARTVTTSYRANGDPYTTTVADSTGTITTVVDALARTVKTTDVWGVTTQTAYDQAGRLTTATTTVPTPAYTSTSAYSYDVVGRVTQQRLEGLVVAVPAYSADTLAVDPGNIVGVSYPTGAGNSGNGTQGTLGYDTLGRPASLSWTRTAGGALITSDAVTRSLSGNVLTTTVDGAGSPAWTYTYDAAGRLTAANGSGHNYQYGYAASGGCGASPGAGMNSNRTTVTDGATSAQFCYDNADRLTSTTQTGYTGAISYDSHGNTTSLAGESYTFDAANRHVATSSATMTVTYQRDASNRIVSRTETPTSGAASVYRYGYTGPGDSTALTLDVAYNVLDRTVSLPGGATLTGRGAASVWSYPNLHGDNVAIADNAGAKQGTTITYDPYGVPLTGALPDNQSGAFDNGWLGQHQRPAEHATGLLHTVQMGARPYNPMLGRFLSVDPIPDGTPNAYTYVSDPINEFDLNGQWGIPNFPNPIKKAVKAAQVAGRGVANLSRQALHAARDGRWGRCARSFRCAVGVSAVAVLGGAVVGAACTAAAGSGGTLAAVCAGAGGLAAWATNATLNATLNEGQGSAICRAMGGLNPFPSGPQRWAVRGLLATAVAAVCS